MAKTVKIERTIKYTIKRPFTRAYYDGMDDDEIRAIEQSTDGFLEELDFINSSDSDAITIETEVTIEGSNEG